MHVLVHTKFQTELPKDIFVMIHIQFLISQVTISQNDVIRQARHFKSSSQLQKLHNWDSISVLVIDVVYNLHVSDALTSQNFASGYYCLS